MTTWTSYGSRKGTTARIGGEWYKVERVAPLSGPQFILIRALKGSFGTEQIGTYATLAEARAAAEARHERGSHE